MDWVIYRLQNYPFSQHELNPQVKHMENFYFIVVRAASKEVGAIRFARVKGDRTEQRKDMYPVGTNAC